MIGDPKYNESLGRNAIVEQSIAWPQGIAAGVSLARTVIDGEDTLVVRAWCPNIRGTFVELHFRSTERVAANEAYQTAIYGISKLGIHERRTVMTPVEFARRMDAWKANMQKDQRLSAIGLVPIDTDWRP